MRRYLSTAIAVIFFNYEIASAQLLERRFDFDQDGSYETLVFSEENLSVAVTINSFQQVEKLNVKQISLDPFVILDVEYQRKGQAFVLTRSFSSTKRVFNRGIEESRMCVMSQFKARYPEIKIAAGFMEDLSKSWYEFSSRTLSSKFDSSCDKPPDFKKKVIKSINRLGEDDFKKAKDIAACTSQSDPIAAANLYLPYLLRSDSATQDKIGYVGKFKCEKIPDALGQFRIGDANEQPTIVFNSEKLAVESEAEIEKTVVKELLRATGMYDDSSAKCAIENCFGGNQEQAKSLFERCKLRAAIEQREKKQAVDKEPNKGPSKFSQQAANSPNQITTTPVPIEDLAPSGGASKPQSASPPTPAAASASAKPSVGETYDQQRPVEFPKEIRASDMPNPGSPNFGRAVVSLVREQLIAPALASMKGVPASASPGTRRIASESTVNAAQMAGRVTVITPNAGRAVQTSVNLEDGSARVPTAEQLAAKAQSRSTGGNVAGGSSGRQPAAAGGARGQRRGVASVGGSNVDDPSQSSGGSIQAPRAGAGSAEDVIRSLARAPYTEVPDLIQEKDYATIQGILKDPKRSPQLIQILKRNSITIYDSRGNVIGHESGRVILKDTGSQIIPAN